MGTMGGWRRNGRKALYVNQGYLLLEVTGSRSQSLHSSEEVRLTVEGAKGGRKVDE